MSPASAEPRKAPVVVALCFLPDTGHVTPLMRLARLVGRHTGARVIAILPARFERAALDLGLEFHALEGIDQGASAAFFASLSQRSIFYSAFSYDHDILDHYWAGLHEAAAGELAHVAATLEALHPWLLLADTHVFGNLYRQLAAGCGAQLVLNRAVGGTLRYRPRPFIRSYGLNDVPVWMQRVVEFGGGLHARIFLRWRRHFHPGRRRLTESRVAMLAQRAREVLGTCEPAAESAIVSSGISAIEHRVALRPDAPRHDREVVLAPLVDVEVAALPPDLETWLASQPRGRVVYVCFGTMVRPGDSLLRSILQGLREADVSVLWAQPRAQREWAVNERESARIRFEDFAPQASLLVAGRVDCFVTHAGQGAVQEALLGGVPMLCVPFLWDQPYMASVVERLGAGIRHFPRSLTQRQVTAGINELLGNPTYRARAREIALELRALQQAPAQTAWIDALAPTANVVR